MGKKLPYCEGTKGRRPPFVRKRIKILLLLLAVAAVLLAVDEVPISSEAKAGTSVGVETDPESFPEMALARPFNFHVTVLRNDVSVQDAHLSLEAACPEGGVATLSDDAAGNACEGPIETLSKSLDSGSASWAFAVMYQGSPGTYQWTIEAHGDEDEDEDCGPGFWKNHEELWDGVADDVTLLEALETKGGKLMALNRHAAAALLNADSADYPLSVSEVIELYKDAVGAVVGPETISSAVEILTTNNAQADCEFDD